MHEQDLRELIAAVSAGRVSRRTFAHRMIGLGLTVPFASQLLAHAGFAQSPAPIDYKPTRAGGGGALRTRKRRNFLRTAGGLRSQWEAGSDARRRDPGHRERRGCR